MVNETIGPEKAPMDQYPERVLQFGEGNFIRAFIDWMIHRMNTQGLFQGRIVVVQPTPRGKIVPVLNRQDGAYTLILRGYEEGKIVDRKEVIHSISRGLNPYTEWDQVLKLMESPAIQLIFSNTTEVGLHYLREAYQPGKAPLSFPGKLTACLYHRFQCFNGDPSAGMTVIPLELVENNGKVLRENVLRCARDWDLSNEFIRWVEEENRFCNTLVDRIVTGFPKDEAEDLWEEMGYKDELMTVGEPYHLLVIEGDPLVRELLPFHLAGLNVHWDQIATYRELKIHVLNAAHTIMATVGYLKGLETVLDVMNDGEMFRYVTRLIKQEILPCLSQGEEMKKAYADSVIERFRNPLNKHYLLDISLNAVTKFQERVLPVLERYYRQFKKPPRGIAYAFAALLLFYRNGGRDHEVPVRDREEVLSAMREAWSDAGSLKEGAARIFSLQSVWGIDLNRYPGLLDSVSEDLAKMLDRIEPPSMD